MFDVETLQMFPRICIMWNDYHPIPEMIEVFLEGEVQRQPLSIEELMVCEHCLSKDHESEKCKQEGRQKEKEDENLLSRAVELAEEKIGMQKRREESSRGMAAEMESIMIWKIRADNVRDCEKGGEKK